MGSIIGGVSAAIGLGNQLFGGGGNTGGFSGGSQPPQTYIPTAQPQADVLYQNLWQRMNQGGQNLEAYGPYYQALYSNVASNPYAMGGQNAAIAASQFGQNNLFPLEFGGAGALYGGAGDLLSGAGRVMQTGFDPQQALYNRTQQQVTDQTNAMNAMSGVRGPYAAGVGNQALSNFNIDWQNQQLGRQLEALRGAGGAFREAGQGFAGAADLGQAGQNTLMTSGQLPYQTVLGQLNDQFNALNRTSQGYQGLYGLDQNTLNALSNYLKLGQNAVNLGQQGAAQQFGQNQQLGYGFGQGLDALSQLYGGMNWGGGGGDQGMNAGYQAAFPGFDFLQAG